MIIIWMNKKEVCNLAVIVHFCASLNWIGIYPKKGLHYFDCDFHFLLPLKNCPCKVSQDLNKYIYSLIILPLKIIIIIRNTA